MNFKLGKRKLNTHKGDYGKIAIIGGSRGMAGSVILSTKAALKMGSGLVYTIVPEIIGDIVALGNLEAMVRYIKNAHEEFTNESVSEIIEYIKDLDAIAYGPGTGLKEDKFKILKTLIKSPINLVIDADGLDLLGENLHILKENKKDIILTPHMGEFSKITGIDIDKLSNNRKYYGENFAKKYKIYLVLKGNKTQIFGPNGEYYENNTGNPAMATGGSGDILTGMILSLIAQNYEPFKAAAMAVYFHGLAGDMARDKLGEASVIASDIVDNIPFVLKG